MKKNYPLLFLLFCSIMSEAQVMDTSASWAYWGGVTTPGTNTSVPSSVGGGFDPANRPKNRYYAHTWVDRHNRLWLFGGSAGTNAAIALNDLWVFDRTQGANGSWKWAGGSGDNGKHTGTKAGAPSTANIPSARHQANIWQTQDGKVWIFGGQQVYVNNYNSASYGNDLWRFDPLAEEWAWIDGDLPTAAGTTGTRPGSYPAQLGDEGMPRGRGWSAVTVDNAGNLWMFGGSTNGLANAFLSDVWKYDVTTAKWYLIWGSATPGAAVDYNGQQTPGTPGGNPGGRHAMASWSDAQGNIWIYGGHNATHFFSDMWKFDIATQQWTWMSGSNQPSAMPPQNNNDGNGYWGARGVPSTDRYPGKRYGMASVKDKQGRFWLHGGRAASGTGSNLMNDFWMFDPQTLQWTWMEGDSTKDPGSVLGAIGVSDPSYKPGGRISAGMVAADTSFNFWLWGGFGLTVTGSVPAQRFVGDLWELSQEPPPCSLTASVTVTGSAVFCAGDSVLLKSNQASGASYEWKEGSNILPVTADSIWVKSSGVYSVTLTDQICSVTSSPVSVTANPLPAVSLTPNTAQAICPGDSVLLKATPSGMSYEWSSNGNTIAGTADSIYALAVGAYSVKVTNPVTGCTDTLGGRVNVSLHSTPVVTLNVSGAAGICAGDSLEIRVTSAVSGYSFQWYHDGTLSGNTTDRINAHQQGRYNVLVTEPGNGCHDTASLPVQLTVHPRPVVLLSPSGMVEICQGDQAQLTAAASGNIQYLWKNGGVAFGGNTSQETVVTDGQYYVVVTDNNQCSDSSAVTEVVVRARPSFTVAPWTDTAFCHGNKILCTIVSPDTSLGYQWIKDGSVIPSATLDFYEISTSGLYEVAVYWNAVPGCADTSSSVTVTVHPVPAPDIQYDGTTLTTDTGYAGYKWYAGTQAIVQAQQHSYVPDDNGPYSVVVVDSNGCEGTSRIYNVNNISSGVWSADGERSVGIYPNPVGGGTVFFSHHTPVSYTLYGLDGRMLQRGHDVWQADVSGLPEGVYVIRIENNTGRLLKVERLVKQAN